MSSRAVTKCRRPLASECCMASPFDLRVRIIAEAKQGWFAAALTDAASTTDVSSALASDVSVVRAPFPMSIL